MFCFLLNFSAKMCFYLTVWQVLWEGNMVPKGPGISTHHICPASHRQNHHSLTQNPLCGKNKATVWQAFPTVNSLSSRRPEEG